MYSNIGFVDLTRKRALQLHRRLWVWITLKTLKVKRKVQKVEFPPFSKGSYVDVHNFCFCCEYAWQVAHQNDICLMDICNYCPIDWGYTGECACETYNALYCRWSDLHISEYEEAAEIAFKIANLPERSIE